MVERYLLNVSILRPSNRVILVCMPVWGVWTRERGEVWTYVDSSVGHLCLRPPSPVQSSPFLLCLVFCPCSPCAVLCFRSCVFLGVCLCFLHCLLSCSRLCFSVLLVSCPSQSCLCSCQCVVLSKSCCPSSPSAFNLSQQKVLTSQCSSNDFSCNFSVCRKLIHAVTQNLLALVTRTSSAISCGTGGGRPGCRDNPESLSYRECMDGCRARSSSRIIGCGVPCPANVGVKFASCGALCPAGSLLFVPWPRLPVSSLRYGSLLFVSLLGLPGPSLRYGLACCLGCLAVDQFVARKLFTKPWPEDRGIVCIVVLNFVVQE